MPFRASNTTKAMSYTKFYTSWFDFRFSYLWDDFPKEDKLFFSIGICIKWACVSWWDSLLQVSSCQMDDNISDFLRFLRTVTRRELSSIRNQPNFRQDLPWGCQVGCRFYHQVEDQISKAFCAQQSIRLRSIVLRRSLCLVTLCLTAMDAPASKHRAVTSHEAATSSSKWFHVVLVMSNDEGMCLCLFMISRKWTFDDMSFFSEN